MTTNTNLRSKMTINEFQWPIFTGVIKPDWITTAEAKGFDLVGRIVDRLHLALRCRQCGRVNKVKRFTLMSAQPLCHECIMAEWRKDAVAAGLTFLRRDPTNRHYGIYLSDCGHEVRRQFEMIKRIAASLTGFRCETCHAAREVGEAAARGWSLMAVDPDGDPNYRVYRHDECGHVQRVARANMQSGRFGCGGCGEEWNAAASFIYAMSFTLASGREVVKVGFSRNPESRLHYQLKRDAEMPCQILRMVPIATGHAALCAEKALHRELKRAHPKAVLDPAQWQRQIRVKTEIYDGSVTPMILSMLDALETEHSAA